MPSTLARGAKKKASLSKWDDGRTAIAKGAVHPHHTRHASIGSKVAARRSLQSGVAQTNPEVASTIVSESIGRMLTQRREARAKGDVAVAEELTKRLGRLLDLRDRVHAGDDAAIGDVLTGATG